MLFVQLCVNLAAVNVCICVWSTCGSRKFRPVAFGSVKARLRIQQPCVPIWVPLIYLCCCITAQKGEYYESRQPGLCPAVMGSATSADSVLPLPDGEVDAVLLLSVRSYLVTWGTGEEWIYNSLFFLKALFRYCPSLVAEMSSVYIAETWILNTTNLRSWEDPGFTAAYFKKGTETKLGLNPNTELELCRFPEMHHLKSGIWLKSISFKKQKPQKVLLEVSDVVLY